MIFSFAVPPGNSAVQEEVGRQRTFTKTSQLLHGHDCLGMQYRRKVRVCFCDRNRFQTSSSFPAYLLARLLLRNKSRPRAGGLKGMRQGHILCKLNSLSLKSQINLEISGSLSILVCTVATVIRRFPPYERISQ